MDPEKIKELILARRTGTITDDQLRQLQLWMDETEEHRRLVEDLCDETKIAQEMALFSAFDTQRSWTELQRKYRIGNRWGRVMRWVKYTAASAAAVLLVGITSHLLENRNKTIGELADIHPGSVRATLVINDCDLIELKGLRDTTVYSNGGEQFQIDNNGSMKYRPKSGKTSSITHTIYTPRGGEYKITLCDGTNVWLNSDSRLHYPAEFPDSQRCVKLIGEAYFEVAKDPSRPFIVEAAGMNVRALGTAFNVSAYSEDNYVATTLIEGKVLVSTKDTETILNPGEKGVIEGDHRLEIEPINLELYSKSSDEQFVFDQESIEEVMKKLSRWYDFDYEFANQQIVGKHFTGTLPRYSDIDLVFSIIEQTTDIHFRLKERTIIIN